MMVASYLGWGPLASLRPTHRNTVWASTEMVLSQSLEAVLGRRPTTFVPRPYGPLGRHLWAMVIGPLLACQTAPIPHPLAAAERRVVVRHYHAAPWHQRGHRQRAQLVTTAELPALLPHSGFRPALEILTTQGRDFQRYAIFDASRSGRNTVIFTEVECLDVVLAGFEVSLRVRSQRVAVLPRHEPSAPVAKSSDFQTSWCRSFFFGGCKEHTFRLQVNHGLSLWTVQAPDQVVYVFAVFRLFFTTKGGVHILLLWL